MAKIKTTSVREKEEEDELLFVAPELSNRDDGNDENEDYEEEEQHEASQAQLFSDMMKITKKKGEVQQVVRTTLGSSAVDTSHLLTRLGPSSSLKNRHSHTLPLPLEKTAAKRIQRAAGYENVAMEVNKWAKVVKMRREAQQLHFPLERSDLRLKTVEKTDTLQMRTPLEQEVYSLLQGAKLVQTKKETEEEQAVRKSLSIQEIRERNKELWRQKEMKRRYEQKARLMNKSKSRKHHRLLRRERLRKQRAELEELQKTDPEMALERLKELEQARIEERISLRHKTSKWAHLQGFRATRDKAAMAALQENQRMHKELTTKTDKPVNSEDDDSDDDTTKGEGRVAAAMADPNNPWTKHLPGAAMALKDSNEDESFTRFKKFWEEVNKRKEMDQKIEKQMEKERGERNGEAEGQEEEEKELGGEDDGSKENKGKIQEEEGKQRQDEKERQSQENGKLLQESDKNAGMTNSLQERESNASENKATKKGSRRKKNNKRGAKTLQNPSQDTVSIDDLFDEVEIGIKNKIKKKLTKLGVKSDEPWKKVKTKNKGKKAKTSTITDTCAEIEEFDFTSMHNQDNIDERKERATTLQDLEALEGESVDKLQAAVQTLKKGSSAAASGTATTTTTKPQMPKLQVDPNKFLQVEPKRLATALPDSVGEAGEAMDDEEETQEKAEDIIREAFADDYLMEEFSAEKAEAVKKDHPNGMSLALPGWGDWTGPNIKMSNRKIKKFKLRVPHVPRKDTHIGHVLYNESADVHDNLRKAMVSDLPYPFKSVKDFEASVRAPVGRLFVPETAYKRLTAPPTVTKLGTVIQPMTEDELLRHDTKNERRQSEPMGRGKKRQGADAGGGQKSRKRKVEKTGKKNSR